MKGAIQTIKDNYERLRKEYLNICDEDCGGDPSTGIQPCPFFEYEEGCLLKSEKFRAAPGGLNNLAAAVHENAVAHGWWEQERELPEILMLNKSRVAADILPDVQECSLEQAVIKLLCRIRQFAENNNTNRLMDISEDGIIDETERPDFDRIIKELDGIVKAAMQLKYAKEITDE